MDQSIMKVLPNMQEFSSFGWLRFLGCHVRGATHMHYRVSPSYVSSHMEWFVVDYGEERS